MGIFEGSAQVLGEIIGFGITAVLFIVCVLPIYFIFKLMSGSKTSFTEDLKEYLAWRWPNLKEYLAWRWPPEPSTGDIEPAGNIENTVHAGFS
jgi:hypothetical protein